jgi:hypothetical protein
VNGAREIARRVRQLEKADDAAIACARESARILAAMRDLLAAQYRAEVERKRAERAASRALFPRGESWYAEFD